jgi:nucleoside-diphosphate-sugar epimerase
VPDDEEDVVDIFVTGGTGALGSRVVRRLVRAGHQVTATARSGSAAEVLARAGVRPVTCDLFDPTALRRAVAGHEAVLHLATAIPTGAAALRTSAWTMTSRLRREASRNLVNALLASGGRRYVQESLAFAYPDSRDRWLDEDAPLDPHPVQAAILDGEAQTQHVCDSGRAGVVLRFGMFYGAGSAHTRQELVAARRGLAVRPGPPGAYLAVVHLDDAAAAVETIGLHAPGGVYNVVDDEPLTRREHADVLAAAVGVGKVRLLPSWVGRVGKLVAVARSQRVHNHRARGAGWSPVHRRAREGWRQVIAEDLGVDA